MTDKILNFLFVLAFIIFSIFALWMSFHESRLDEKTSESSLDE